MQVKKTNRRDIVKGTATPITSGKEIYQVVWPLSKWAGAIVPSAPRPATLEGKTIAEVSGAFYGDVTFPMLETMLKEKYHGIKFLPPSTWKGVEEGEWGKALKAKKVDAMMTGNGC